MGGHGGRGRDGGRPLTLGSERVRAGKPFSSIICGAHAPADKKPSFATVSAAVAALSAVVVSSMTTHRPPAASTWIFFPLQDPQGNSGHSQLYHTECNPRARERSRRGRKGGNTAPHRIAPFSPRRRDAQWWSGLSLLYLNETAMEQCVY